MPSAHLSDHCTIQSLPVPFSSSSAVSFALCTNSTAMYLNAGPTLSGSCVCETSLSLCQWYIKQFQHFTPIFLGNWSMGTDSPRNMGTQGLPLVCGGRIFPLHLAILQVRCTVSPEWIQTRIYGVINELVPPT